MFLIIAPVKLGIIFNDKYSCIVSGPYSTYLNIILPTDVPHKASYKTCPNGLTTSAKYRKHL